MADSPAAPAVSSFDPVEWTKRINHLEEAVNRLTNENFDLKSQVTRHQNAAAVARGAMKPVKDEVDVLRAKLAASENLKELARLRAEVAKIHTERAKRERERAEEDRKTQAQVQDLTTRAIRAEGKFQALESTAAMMAQSRDNANASAQKMMAERDEALAKAAALKEDLDQAKAELVKALADLRAKNQPAAAAAAKSK